MALGFASCLRFRISSIDPPDAAASEWAETALENAIAGEAIPDAPTSAQAYRPSGPIVVTLFRRGRAVVRWEREGTLAEAIRFATQRIAEVREQPHFLRPRVYPRVTVPLGYGPLHRGSTFIEGLSLVPILEGIEGRFGDRRAMVTPDDLVASGIYDRGVPTPIPELKLGVPIDELRDHLARELGVSAGQEASVALRRFRAAMIGGPAYPRMLPVSEKNLREAAVDGARFLLRHQRRNGQYTYVYDASRGRERPEEYNLPRHAGTSYFLAQVDRLHGMPEAREGALRALTFLKNHFLEACPPGAPEAEGARARATAESDVAHLCVRSRPGIADVGSAALTVIAATEILSVAPDPLALELTLGLTAFLRAQQRDDGELMHDYDIEAKRPIDVQHMYYSGEAAFALLKAHEATGDGRNLDAARRVMSHLTGRGWNFLGSRYYYGEEHWTCIAAGEAGTRVPTGEAIEFCDRWLRWNDAIQFRRGETPWPSDGAFGAGPLILPRLTPVGSRSEALIAIYDLFEREGRDTQRLRRVIESGLSQMLRYQWRPGPVHLFHRPDRAIGGMPGSPAELVSRNDFVQHAGSAYLRWADRLRREAERRNSAPLID